jgi:hypothetical protein
VVTAEQGTFTFAGSPCRHPTTVLRWHRMATGACHLGRYCAGCWQQRVPQTETALAAAPPRPRG